MTGKQEFELQIDVIIFDDRTGKTIFSDAIFITTADCAAMVAILNELYKIANKVKEVRSADPGP